MSTSKSSEDTLEVVQQTPGTSPARPGTRWLHRLVTAAVGLAAVGCMFMAATFVVLSQDLPEIRSLADYHPKQATILYGAKGQVVARFATERRTVVDFARIPKVMIDAVVSAEDADFFNHEGLDYLGILRCVIKNTIAGRKLCGGSTITQQTVKTFLLTSKKTYGRKLREIILAKRVEESLSKEDILYLYLNQINFGRAYGVQEAAQVYFGKDVDQITVEEAALLAGLPQTPARLDPYRYPERALKRRAYVLEQMHRLNKISDEEYEHARATGLKLDWRSEDSPVDNRTHYAAHVRALLEEKFGEDKATDGGLKVYTSIDPLMQHRAETELRSSLEALDKRQGWRGPIAHLDPDRMKKLLALLEERRATVEKSRNEKAAKGESTRLAWDLSRVLPTSPKTPVPVAEALESARFVPVETGATLAGIVSDVDDVKKVAVVKLAAKLDVQIPVANMKWARPYSLSRYTRSPKKPSSVLTMGDVVLVRLEEHKKDGSLVGSLDQKPKVEGAFVVIDPASRRVRALVGGYGTGAGTFNRATQARRQAGSTFKPILYAAAFETGKFSTISTCLDAPHVYRDPWTKKTWEPKNYDGRFDGEITLRLGLTKSKNLCSVWLIEHVGVEKVISAARRLGIESPLPKSNTLALGSGDVSPLEMVNAYATLASMGEWAEPVFIEKVVSAEGQTLYEVEQKRAQRLSQETAYQVISLMTSVVQDGTAQRVKRLGRPIAGKTGTTNEARNAWFIGFTPDLVAGVWVGFDNNAPLGPGETGGRAAIPAWLGFMEQSLEGEEVHDFSAPPGIVFAYVDPESGRLVSPGDPKASVEPFVEGMEPSEFLTEAKTPDQIWLDDYER